MLALGLENARIAGISMGSAIAQELALSYPERFAVWFLSAPGRGATGTPKPSLNTLRRCENLLRLLIYPTPSVVDRLCPYYQEHFDEMMGDQTKAQED